MKKRLILSLSLLFLLFSLGAILSILYSYKITRDLKTVINLHRVEIIRQNLVINLQTVQSNLYTTGTVFGKELDVIVENVAALDSSIRSCSGCHHSDEMTARLKEVSGMIEQYEEAISYLITTTANQERIDRLKIVAVGIGDMLLQKTQEMSFLADKRLNERTVRALDAINKVKTYPSFNTLCCLYNCSLNSPYPYTTDNETNLGTRQGIPFDCLRRYWISN